MARPILTVLSQLLCSVNGIIIFKGEKLFQNKFVRTVHVPSRKSGSIFIYAISQTLTINILLVVSVTITGSYQSVKHFLCLIYLFH